MSARLKGAECEGCPYADLPDRRMCGPEGPASATVVLCAERPGETELAGGRPLHPEGKTGKEVRAATAGAEARGIEIFYTNVLKCAGIAKDDKENPARFAAATAHCTRVYLERELAALTAPSVRLVCLGGDAVRAVIGLRGMARWHGSGWTRAEVEAMRRIARA